MCHRLDAISMEEIQAAINKAGILFDADQYERAYSRYGDAIKTLLARLADTRGTRKISKSAGWGAALLTGGFGLEDLVVVPLVNKGLLKLLGLNLPDLLQKLQHSTTQRLTILGLSNEVLENTEETEVLRDFLIAYKLADDSDQDHKVQRVFDLINPFTDVSKVTGSEEFLSATEINALLAKEIIGSGSQVEYINNLLFVYLLSARKQESWLYQQLRKNRECFEAEYQEAHRKNKTSSQAKQSKEVKRARYYGKILGLKGRVTRGFIKRRYRILLMENHPDRHPNATEEIKRQLGERTRRIVEAYEYFRKRYSF